MLKVNVNSKTLTAQFIVGILVIGSSMNIFISLLRSKINDDNRIITYFYLQCVMILVIFNFRPNSEVGVIRTAKAERRAQAREGHHNEEDQLSPADKRRAEAEKRAAWRQARLKSLENVRTDTKLIILCLFLLP